MLNSRKKAKPPIVKVTQVTAEPMTSSENEASDWNKSYEESTWLSPIYQYHIRSERPHVGADIARQSTLMDYSWGGSRLWKRDEKTGLDYICVPESRIKDILKDAHDDGGHWGMESTHMKIRRKYFWPKQSDAISTYIRSCKHCAKHAPWTRKPPIIPILPDYPLLIMGMDFIGPLPKTARGNRYILHLIDYFSSFSITFATKGPSTDDVLPHLETTFSLLPAPSLVYVDNGSHFTSSCMKAFFIRRQIEMEERPTLSSKSTGKIESANRFLQGALRKSTPQSHNDRTSQSMGNIQGDWDLALERCTHQLNSRIIPHIRYSPSEILLGLSKKVMSALQFDATVSKEKSILAESKRIVQEWSPQEQCVMVEHRMVSLCQLREESRVKANSTRISRLARASKGHQLPTYVPNDLVMVRQRNPPKLAAKYRGPFIIIKPSSSRRISYHIRPLSGRSPFPFKIHADDLKPYVPRQSHLSNPVRSEQNRKE